MKKNQGGFSLVEILLMVVILGIIGFVSYFVYNTQKQTSGTQDDTSQSASESTQDKFLDQYLNIQEWEVKIPTVANSVSLTYTLSGSGGISTAAIRSAELDKLSGSCTTNSVIVARGKANDSVPSLGSTTTFETFYNANSKQEPNLTAQIYAKKIGEYYFVPPNYAIGTCFDKPDNESNVKAEQQAQFNIVKSISKIAP